MGRRRSRSTCAAMRRRSTCRSTSTPRRFSGRCGARCSGFPYGETRAYAEVARSIGKPKAVRAVARACATNPVCLVVPCHRVVPRPAAPADTGGEPHARQRLLDRERRKRRSRRERRAPVHQVHHVHMCTSAPWCTLVFSVPSTRYGISPWLDAVPVKKRREFPAFRGVITHPVVIVGGGMSGAMTAYACAVGRLKLDPARSRSHRPWRQRPGDRTAVRRSRASRFASSKPGPEARGARAVRRDAVGAARAGGDGQAPRHPGRPRIGATSFASFRRARPTSCSARARRARRPPARRRRGCRPPPSRGRRRSNPPAAMRLPDAGFVDPFKLTLGFLAAAIKRGAKVYEKSARQEDHVHAQDRDRVSRRRRDHDDQPRRSASASRPACSSR